MRNIHESMSAEYYGIRPNCPCCHGGDVRKGYAMTKAKSAKLSRKAHKPFKASDRRARRAARPDKF